MQKRDGVHFLDPGSESSFNNDSADSSFNNGAPHHNHYGAAVAMMTSGFSGNQNFKVHVRARPPLPRELEGTRHFVNVLRIPADRKSVTLCEHLEGDDGRGGGVYSTQTFTFDRVYDADATQDEVYEHSARDAVEATLAGFNATVLAYGQTSTGKTYTMEGFTSDENRGIVPRATEHVFSYIQQQMQRGQKQYGNNTQFQVRASYLQIYNEIVTDLLKPQLPGGGGSGASKQLVIRQAKNRVYVDGLSEWVVRSPHEIYGLMERGFSMRATGATRMSEMSSRSHAIFVIIVETIEGESVDAPTSFKVGKLNIVDLAGSEKVRQSGVTGVRLEETKKINWSLHELGNVISALTDPTRKDKHIPYRNSKLTHLLTDSLGGNCKTTLIACISPALESYAESLSTLKFANRAKNIKNDAVVNDDVTDPRALAVKYERELKRLRTMLAEKNGGVMPPGVLDVSGLPNSSSAGGGDGNSAMTMMMMNVSADDKRYSWGLRERIRDLENIMQTQGIVLNPDGTVSKLDGLHGGNSAAAAAESEEDKAQVERYKQLLLKQRDIMLNLTTRLNERDESILRLQEEIDAYDSHVQQLEDQLAFMQTQVGNSNDNGSPSMAQPAHHFTPEEADQFVASRRVTARHGAVRYLSEASLGDGNASQQQLLGAEEKIREMLVSGVVAANSELGAATSFGGGDAQAILDDRIESSVRNVLRGKCFALQNELHTAQERCRMLEQRMKIAEAAAVASTATSEDFDRVKQALRATVDAALQMKLERALDELQRERAEKVQHATDLERVTTEVAVMSRRLAGVFRQTLNRPDLLDEFNTSVSRITSMLSQTEQSLIREAATWLQESPTVAAPSSAPFTPQQQQQYQEQITALQQTIDSLRRQQQPSGQQQQQQQSNAKQREAELQAAAEERARAYRQLEGEYRQLQQTQAATSSEVQTLRRQMATHQKDRRALRTILDSRIKVKVDNVLQALSKENGGTDGNRYVRQEMTALQNLVNASVSAMDADTP